MYVVFIWHISLLYVFALNFVENAKHNGNIYTFFVLNQMIYKKYTVYYTIFACIFVRTL